MWSEEEMRELPDPEPARKAVPSRAGGLRWALAQSNAVRAQEFACETTRSSVVYGPGQNGTHGNFVDAAYRRILARPEWAARLTKAHTAGRQARPQGDVDRRKWRELDASTSSDALLMNVFCYPRAMPGLACLLGVEPREVPEFGYRPEIPCTGTLPDRTEVDMRLGDLLVEAKLTEADFQRAPLRLLERYCVFGEVFDAGLLVSTGGKVEGYQLVRGVLAARHTGGRFAVIVDGRRPDLLEGWFSVVRAVRDYELRGRLRLVTWQELAGVLPKGLREFMGEKYGIFPNGKLLG